MHIGHAYRRVNPCTHKCQHMHVGKSTCVQTSVNLMYCEVTAKAIILFVSIYV